MIKYIGDMNNTAFSTQGFVGAQGQIVILRTFQADSKPSNAEKQFSRVDSQMTDHIMTIK